MTLDILVKGEQVILVYLGEQPFLILERVYVDLLEPVYSISFSMLYLSFDKSFLIIPHTITLSTV